MCVDKDNKMKLNIDEVKMMSLEQLVLSGCYEKSTMVNALTRRGVLTKKEAAEIIDKLKISSTRFNSEYHGSAGI